jgi:cytochrome P450
VTSHRAGTEAVPPPGCPAHNRTPLYGPAFAANPTQVYERLRQHGPVAPVDLAPGVPATLVTSYSAALRVLRNPGTFPKDPRAWQNGVPEDCPVLPLMGYQPTTLFTDGDEHTRLRAAVTDSLDRVDPLALRGYVEHSADTLITQFSPTGRADLLAHYAAVVPLLVFNHLFGCPPSLGDRLVTGTTTMFDGSADATRAFADVKQCLRDLIALKRQQPQADLTSWLMAHSARLTNDEMVYQLAVLMGAGTQPMQNLIANALRLLLSDDRFAGDLSGGSLPVQDALDEVLWTDPPMANYAITYPVQDLDFEGVRLPANQPVVISLAAANTAVSLPVDQRTGNRAHLAWSAGPHTCPAQQHARLIAAVAIEKILDRLPDMHLAVPADQLTWRPGPFHRALTALPVRFSPVSVPVPHDHATQRGQGNDNPAPAPATPLAVTSTPRPAASVNTVPRRPWRSVGEWWHGQ